MPWQNIDFKMKKNENKISNQKQDNGFMLHFHFKMKQNEIKITIGGFMPWQKEKHFGFKMKQNENKNTVGGFMP